MSHLGITLDRSHPIAPARSPSHRRQPWLLACGVFALPVYLAADFLGGLRYPGYSFTSQIVSELMARGAPSEHFVDPIFLAFGAVVLAFGVGVLREATRDDRAIRIVGALLVAYAIIGFTGPTLFEMSPRGTAAGSGDLPHIVLTVTLVALTVAMLGFGAFALGRRFRLYSLVTLLTMIGLGAATSVYGARVAAGEATPGFGVVERVLIYSSLVWVAVLAIGLLRRQLAKSGGLLT